MAWVCVLLGLLVERTQRDGTGVLVAGFGGLSLLLAAGRHFAEGDTMAKVAAVLDSNFWLTTHVLTTTAGYFGALAAEALFLLFTVPFIPSKSKSPAGSGSKSASISAAGGAAH